MMASRGRSARDRRLIRSSIWCWMSRVRAPFPVVACDARVFGTLANSDEARDVASRRRDDVVRERVLWNSEEKEASVPSKGHGRIADSSGDLRNRREVPLAGVHSQATEPLFLVLFVEVRERRLDQIAARHDADQLQRCGIRNHRQPFETMHRKPRCDEAAGFTG